MMKTTRPTKIWRVDIRGSIDWWGRIYRILLPHFSWEKLALVSGSSMVNPWLDSWIPHRLDSRTQTMRVLASEGTMVDREWRKTPKKKKKKKLEALELFSIHGMGLVTFSNLHIETLRNLFGS